MHQRRIGDYTPLELRQIILRRRRELAARDAELRREQHRIEAERSRIAAELADLDQAERLLEEPY